VAVNKYKGLVAISKGDLTKEEINRELRVYGKGYQSSLLIQDCYRSDSLNWYVPIAWAAKKGLLTDENDTRPKIEAKWPKSEFSPRDNQQEVFDATVEHLLKNVSGRISCPTGWGKTYISLQVAKKLNTNILYLVHKNDVLKQVKQTAKNFFNIKKCGEVRGDKCETDHLITLCTMQTMAKRVEDNPEWLNKFGLLILDESHRASCASYKTIMEKLCPTHALGISATHRRSDGLEGVWKNFLGDLIIEGKKNNARIPHLEVPSIGNTGLSTRSFYDWQGELSHTKALTEIAENIPYNIWIVSRILELLEEGRRPIVCTDRKSQLEILEDMLNEKGIKSVGVYAGGKHRDKTLKEEDLVRSMKQDVILCTTKKVGEGFDFDMFLGAEAKKYQEPDTIILCSMTKDSQQVIGRVSRKAESKHPLIIHPVLNIGYCQSIFTKCWNMVYLPLGIKKKIS